MEYLREFEKEADVIMNVLPNVVLANDTNKVLYNVKPVFVYIQHVDGRLIKPDQWVAEGFASAAANGVAVVTDEAKFVVRKTTSSKMTWSSDSNTLVEGALTTTDSALAATDYAGKANTEAAAKNDRSGIFSYVANLKMPNGQTCYVPALGELNVARSLSEDIDNAMSIIEGEPPQFTAASLWSSTQYNNGSAWYMFYGTLSYTPKVTSVALRAFAPLDL